MSLSGTILKALRLNPKVKETISPDSPTEPVEQDFSLLSDRLHDAWHQYTESARTTEILIVIVKEYLRAIEGHTALTNRDLKKQFMRLTALQAAVEQLIRNEEGLRPENPIDIDHVYDRDNFLELWEKDKRDFQHKQVEYKKSIGILNDQIDDINQKITDIRAEQVLEKLTDLQVFQQLHLEIDEEINKLQAQAERLGVWSKFFCCGASSVIDELNIKITKLQTKRERLKAGDIEDVRKTLISSLQLTIEKKRKEQEILINNQPQYDDTNEKKYIEMSALIQAEAREANSKVSQPLMLQFIRLYVYLELFYKSIASGVEADMNTSLKDLSQQLVRDIRDYLAIFYCMTPGRQDFDEYWKRYMALSNSEKEKLLGKHAALEVIYAVFPNFDMENATVNSFKPSI